MSGTESEPLIQATGEENTAPPDASGGDAQSSRSRVLRASWGGGARGFLVIDADGPLSQVAPYWWAFLFRGFFLCCFGLFCLFYPELTVLYLTLIFGYYMFVDGVLSLILMCGSCGSTVQTSSVAKLSPVLYLFVAACDFVIGITTFMHPEVTATLLLILVASWLIALGTLEVLLALCMRRDIRDGTEWFLGVGGALSFIFGVIILRDPTLGILAFTGIIGIVTIIHGFQQIHFATNLRILDSLLRHVATGEEGGLSRLPVEATLV